MSLILMLIYLIFSFLVAYLSKNARIGFWGVLLMCIFLSPLVTGILVLMFQMDK